MPFLRPFAIVIVAVCPLGAALTKTVATESGRISGTPAGEKAITIFKGIPFAAPPVGNLRWKAPQPPVPWTGVRRADKFGANCMQSILEERKPWTREFMAHGEVSEDCLFLNIWTPANRASDKRPVLVFLHGGGNNEGSGSVAAYDGEGLARKGVVMVTVNYRLNVLGFFTHPELTKESGYNASGNYALLDQIAALKWVHRNIAAFGGDPDRVTVAGQSAGASDAQLLVVSPLAKGLFQRAILESGGASVPGMASGRKLADSEQDGVKFAEAKGVHTLAELRAIPWKDLTGGKLRFGPVVDGYVVPAAPREIYAKGLQNDVPTIAGWNLDESGASPHPEITAEVFRAQARQRYGDKADLYLKTYAADSDEEARVQANRAARDSQRVSLDLWAAARGETARSEVYLYSYDHVLPGPDAGKYGAFHTSEVPYVLNSLSKSDRPFTEQDRKVAETVSSYWANFAATGDPNGKGLPRWPAAKEMPHMAMEIGDKNGPVPAAGTDSNFAFISGLVRQ